MVACNGGGSGGDVASSGQQQEPGSTRTIGFTQNGKATFYPADGTGACLYEKTSNVMIAAMNAPQYNNAAACGECVEITGPKATIVVKIVDKCPECGSGHIDLSAQAFEMIAEPRLGEVPIQCKPVACEVSGNVTFKFEPSSSQYWIAVQPRNHRIPVSGLSMRNGLGLFLPVQRQEYNYFEVDNPGPGPYTFRVTANDGQQITESDVPLSPGNVVEGSSQFD